LKVLLGAFGDPGHAFPMLALGEALVARGHAVALQTWRRWQEPAEEAGMEFAAAPEYQVFPTLEKPLQPYAAAVRAAVETRPVVRSFAPDVAVSDILTPAPALAAELEGVASTTNAGRGSAWARCRTCTRASRARWRWWRRRRSSSIRATGRPGCGWWGR
jgi:UDP:flavonoid glycosyltransferase YjiC (YdhE family)